MDEDAKARDCLCDLEEMIDALYGCVTSERRPAPGHYHRLAISLLKLVRHTLYAAQAALESAPEQTLLIAGMVRRIKALLRDPNSHEEEVPGG